MDSKALRDVIKNPPAKYRPLPFWSWNERLNTEESMRQVSLMHYAGMGGFFMHARGGLQTEYMGKEWFANVRASIEKAEECGVKAWAYDENGWPSGFGDGAVCAMGEEYCQKYLRMDISGKDGENTICQSGNVRFYYEVNPFYVDNLDKKVVKKFIETAYEPYYERFKNRIEGFFTDEPQIARDGIPWSFCLPGEYEKEYGEELIPKLSHLFLDEEGCADIRVKFYRLVTKLFSESYVKQIYNWCGERGLKLTGHLLLEELPSQQLLPNGACMPHYRYFHIPGMDWLGRDIENPLTPLQVASVAAQYGKRQVLSESFALCGHAVSFSELRKIFEYQMVRGINLLCQHLQGYSLRGIRKRDYPPALNYQQPWWEKYEKFCTAMSRVGMLISEGKNTCSTLLLHPQVSAWSCFNFGENNEMAELEDDFLNTIKILEKKHVEFHLGDELIMEEDAYVKNGKIIIGEMVYEKIIIPNTVYMLESTKKLLIEFKKQGGRIIRSDEITENNICDNENITYLKREFEDFDMHYFVNSTPSFQKTKINVDGMRLDILSGEEAPFSKDYTFTPYDSLVVIDYRKGTKKTNDKKELDSLKLDGEWTLKECTDNALTLDFCDCYFDGELLEKNMPVTSIQQKACNKKRPVDIKCVFHAKICYVPEKIYLVCETPESFAFKINGEEVKFCDEGFFIDSSFRKCDIARYVKKGINEIELSCRFVQSDKTYENIEDAKIYEGVKNKLAYDMEIESIYLIGDFAVRCEGEFESLPKNACRYMGNVEICEKTDKIYLKNIERQGFLNFAGKIVAEKIFFVNDTAKKLVINMEGINVVEVKVNGCDAGCVLWNFEELDISPFLKNGENTIELTITNNLRNFLGPHHLDEGESYFVGPFSFFKDETFWSWSGSAEKWNDGYCIAEMNLTF